MRSFWAKLSPLNAFLVLLAILAAACDRYDTAPLDPQPGPQPGLLAAKGLSKQDEADLKEWEKREKERVREEAETAKDVEKQLEKEWKLFKKKGYDKNDSPLLMCDPLAYDAEVKIIGPEGGEIRMGPHKLTIPRGAVAERVVITGELPVSNLVSVKLSPHGLRFERQPTLELSYKHCYRPANLQEFLVYIDDELNILEWPRSHDTGAKHVVVGRIDHFSKYVLATN